MNYRVTIISGIYNCADTLDESVGSILDQTYQEWKWVLCDDGSTDDTYQIAKKYADQYENIVLIQNDSNQGLNYTLNHCLQYADTEYVARMDGDDISLPDRLEKEVRFLDEHPEYAVVSTGMFYFDEKGTFMQRIPKEHPALHDFPKRTPFCHAPCMVRKEVLDAVEGYTISEKLLRVEDYHLWIKMYAKGFKGYNIQEALYMMRDDREAYHRRQFKYRVNEARVKMIAVKELGLPFTSNIYALRPLLVGLLPEGLYKKLRNR